MKARGLGTKNSIVNFLPVFEKYSSFERTVFFIVMLTDALELRETNHFVVGPAVIHLDFPHTPGPWFLPRRGVLNGWIMISFCQEMALLAETERF